MESSGDHIPSVYAFFSQLAKWNCNSYNAHRHFRNLIFFNEIFLKHLLFSTHVDQSRNSHTCTDIYIHPEIFSNYEFSIPWKFLNKFSLVLIFFSTKLPLWKRKRHNESEKMDPSLSKQKKKFYKQFWSFIAHFSLDCRAGATLINP